MLGGREVVAHVVDGPAAEHVGGAADEVADELGLPRAPRGRTGGLAVGLGERGEQPEGAQVADGLGHRLDGGGVVEVAPGGDVGEQQVVAHHRDEHVDVGRRRGPCAAPIVAHELDADLGVVARVALADVVEEGAEHEQVGPVGAGDEGGGVGARLHQVPVDGEAVVGVALRLAAHGLPLGEHVHPEAHLVERLDHRDGAVPGEEQVDQRPAHVVGPRRRAARRPTPPAGRASRGGSGCRRPRPPRPLAAPGSGRRPGRRRR